MQRILRKGVSYILWPYGNTSCVFAEQPAKWKNGIAKATPFPENNLMLFYEYLPNELSFYLVNSESIGN